MRGLVDVTVKEGVPPDEEFADDRDDDAYFLEEIEEKILLAVEEAGNQRPSADDLASTINENLTRTKYYLDRLLEWGYLFDLLTKRSPGVYGLTDKGRAYLVENDLV